MKIKKSDFVHLHVHSDNSTLDGAATVEELVRKAKSCGHIAMGLTDHGVVTGILDFYKEANKTHKIGSRELGPIKPILGCEIYLYEGDLKARGKDVKSNSYRHLTLIAKNLQGWRNISKLSTLGYTEGFYYKPRVSWEMLEKHSEGVVALSGCLKGPLSVPIVQDKIKKAFQIAGKMQDIYGENLFLEIQPTPIQSQFKVNDACMRFSSRIGIPLVATGDVHYVEKKDFQIQGIKICIAHKMSLEDNRIAHEGIYYRSTEDMYQYFNHVPEAMTNTRRIVDMIDFKLPLVGDGGRYYLPKFECPEGLSEEQYFEKLVVDGAKKRYGEITNVIQERMETEIGVIKNSGFASYFLIVADFIQWAKDNGIPVGPGRGCLTEQSYIYTESGYKSIKDVLPKTDRTINKNGEVVDILKKFEYEVEEDIVDIKSHFDFWSNSQFTKDHEILIKRSGIKDSCDQTLPPLDEEIKWVPAHKVKKGDYVCIPKIRLFKEDSQESLNLTQYKKNIHIEESSTNEDYAKFIGLWIGGGDYLANSGVSINIKTTNIEAMLFLDNYIENVLKVKFVKRSPKSESNLIIYEIFSDRISLHFKDLFGVVHNDMKFIPKEFFLYRKLAESVFKGLIWSNGSSSNQEVYFNTISQKLMHDIRFLGYMLNTPSTVCKKNHDKEELKDSYRVIFACSKFIEDNYDFKENNHYFFEDNNYMYCAVKSVGERHFKGKVYDLMVDGDSPSYLTGGYIVHNSVAGALSAYAMGISDIEPLKNKLLFERFLNPDRVSMPDIDIDFDDTQRERVIDYVKEKYGEECVSQIITFGTMSTKSVIKSISKVYDLPFQDVNKVTKSIGKNPQTGKDHTIKSWRKTEEAKNIISKMPKLKVVLDIAEKLEGKKRDYGKHAAAVVIGDTDLIERIPLTLVGQKGSKSKTTQFPMAQVEEVGLLKMDFLGLRTLSVIQNAENLISRKEGRKFVVKDEINLEDSNLYKFISTGHTKGLFQIESPGFRTLLKNMKPTCFDDIVASVAIYRPGPLGVGMDKTYCLRKNKEEEISYLHPCLEPFLEETMGGIIYQEQIMMIANECAGFTMAEADVLRKGVGKKKPEVIAKMKPKFISGMNSVSGVEVEIAEEIWSQIEFFAEYGFNRSHSAAYATITMYTTHLKYYYPTEFMAALLSSFCNDRSKMLYYIEECKRMKIEIIPPHIQKSKGVFSVEDDKIIYGLKALEGLGSVAVESILETRSKIKDFYSIFHFCESLVKSISQTNLETLIKAGAFRDFGHQAQLLEVAESALSGRKKAVKNKKQKGLFDFVAKDELKKLDERRIPDIKPFSEEEIQEMEKEVLGIYLHGHPLDKYEHLLKAYNTHNTVELNALDESEGNICIGGIISKFEERMDKNNNPWARVYIRDQYDQSHLFCWASSYKSCKKILLEKQKVFIKAQCRVSDKGKTVSINEIISFKDMEDQYILDGKHKEEELKEPENEVNEYDAKTKDEQKDSVFKNDNKENYREEEVKKVSFSGIKDSLIKEKKKKDISKEERYLINIVFSYETTDEKTIDGLEYLFEKNPGYDIVRFKFKEKPNDIYQSEKMIYLTSSLEEKIVKIVGAHNFRVFKYRE